MTQPWAQPVLRAKECAGQHKQRILAGLRLCLSRFSKQLPLLYKARDFGTQSWCCAEFPQPCVPLGLAPCALCWGQVSIVPFALLSRCPPGFCCSRYCWLMSRLSSPS